MLESHAIDESSEWRSFNDSVRARALQRAAPRSRCPSAPSPFARLLTRTCHRDVNVVQDKGNRSDPNRVGGPSNPLLSGGGLGTGMARPTDAASHAYVPPGCASRLVACG